MRLYSRVFSETPLYSNIFTPLWNSFLFQTPLWNFDPSREHDTDLKVRSKRKFPFDIQTPIWNFHPNAYMKFPFETSIQAQSRTETLIQAWRRSETPIQAQHQFETLIQARWEELRSKHGEKNVDPSMPIQACRSKTPIQARRSGTPIQARQFATSVDPLSLSLLVCSCVGVFGFVVSVVDFYFYGWFLILSMGVCVLEKEANDEDVGFADGEERK